MWYIVFLTRGYLCSNEEDGPCGPAYKQGDKEDAIWFDTKSQAIAAAKTMGYDELEIDIEEADFEE